MSLWCCENCRVLLINILWDTFCLCFHFGLFGGSQFMGNNNVFTKFFKKILNRVASNINIDLGGPLVFPPKRNHDHMIRDRYDMDHSSGIGAY